MANCQNHHVIIVIPVASTASVTRVNCVTLSLLNLSVTAPPRVSIEPQTGSVELERGQSALLTCLATGKPRPIVIWSRSPFAEVSVKEVMICCAAEKIFDAGGAVADCHALSE